MPFGKSMATMRPAAAPDVARVAASARLPAGDRYHLLRETMLRILNQTSSIANAVRTNGSFALTILDDQTDPASRPIFIKGFNENFTVADSRHVRYAIYGYISDQDPQRFDPSAQLHLHELTGRIMELNIYCQKAEREGALSIALQSPALPPLIDVILAGASHFAGYFENMTADATAPENETDLDASERRRLVIEQHRHMSQDRMLDPSRYDACCPQCEWPYRGFELLRDAHLGQGFINEVYFPVDYVKPLLDYAARTNRFVMTAIA